MIIVEVELHNYTRFRGTHVLRLEPGVYAVTASDAADPLASNWKGKTAWMRSVPFALYGEMPPKCRHKEDWISRGEGEGHVRLLYDNSLEVRRSLKRGEPVQLDAWWDEERDRKHARGERAQEVIDQQTGFDSETFFWCAFFKQRSMNELLTCRPGDLHAAAVGWFGLSKAVEAEERCKKELAAIEKEAEARRTTVTVSDQLVARALEAYKCADVAELAQLKEEAEAVAGDLRDAAVTLQKELDEYSDWAVKEDQARRYYELREEAARVKAELKSLHPKALAERLAEARQENADAQAAVKAAAEKTREREGQARGKFDGVCPVMCEECPVATEVRSTVSGNRKVLEKAEAAEARARRAASSTRDSLLEAETAMRRARALKEKFSDLRSKAAVFDEAREECEDSGEMPDVEQLRSDVAEAWDKCNAADVLWGSLSSALKSVEDEVEKSREVREALDKVDDRVALYSAALAVLGPLGARRLIAEQALGEVEEMANGALLAAGIDLRASVEWERAARGKASHCGQCGKPFARSARVLVCDHCGAPRLGKTVNELSIKPNAASDGAADDIVGFSAKLALSAWRRARNGAALSTAFIDEPTAYMDESNRAAFCGQLVAMLGSRYGFRQAFVTSHDASVLASLPKRVEIVADGEWSSVGEQG